MAIKYIYDHHGFNLLRKEDATPQCGIDFCDDCGDCLACYESDACGGQDGCCHFWVEYQKEEAV